MKMQLSDLPIFGLDSGIGGVSVPVRLWLQQAISEHFIVII
jgi:hypothetical protein